MEEADELEYLRWFRANADFGPAHENVIAVLHRDFTNETGKLPPKEWDQE
jgi:hypothetical protein